MSKMLCTWRHFKRHYSEADKQRCYVLKESGGSRANQQANNTTMYEDLSSMFNTAMGNFAEVTEESVHDTIKSKFGSLEEKYKASRYKSGDDKLESMKKTIAVLEKKPTAMTKSDCKHADGQIISNSGEDTKKKYGHSSLTLRILLNKLRREQMFCGDTGDS